MASAPSAVPPPPGPARPVLTPDDARARHIRRSDMVACALAFIDCKMPGSERKLNYSLVGPGVTQSRDQVVNLTEAHGFSLGVAAMPPGNGEQPAYPLHRRGLHDPARHLDLPLGRRRQGRRPITGGPGDIVSVPTWIFRGFTNTGDVDGWIFTALGGDDTGGIIWHPSILARPRRSTGMFLTQREHAGRHRRPARARPAAEALMPRAERRSRLRRCPAIRQGRDVCAGSSRRRQRAWSGRGTTGFLPAGPCQPTLAPVIGHGMTQDRSHAARPSATRTASPSSGCGCSPATRSAGIAWPKSR